MTGNKKDLRILAQLGRKWDRLWKMACSCELPLLLQRDVFTKKLEDINKYHDSSCLTTGYNHKVTRMREELATKDRLELEKLYGWRLLKELEYFIHPNKEWHVEGSSSGVYLKKKFAERKKS